MQKAELTGASTVKPKQKGPKDSNVKKLDGGTVNMHDREMFRNLAYRYSEIANSDRNAENIKLHKAVNDLRQIRPVVLIDELPWHEMNIDDELTLRTEDPFLRSIEWFLRSSIYKNKYMPADMVVPPFVPVSKVFHTTDIGTAIEEDVLATDKNNRIISHRYHDVLSTEEDLEKLRTPDVTYDKNETMRRYNLVGELIGDIIPVRLVGINVYGFHPWDDIARYRGVTNLMIDLIERPDFMKKIVRKLTDISLSCMDQFEALGLLDAAAVSTLHCTPIHTDDLPGENFDVNKVTRKNIWGRGMAQIFGSVSKEMHDEFDISYMIETIGRCGLSYYGCCEPLDKKIDIVGKIPNLRKISVTPWADVNIAAEAIGRKYVLSAKPNPASVAVPVIDKYNLRKEIKKILDACTKNNCSCDIVLKDISTCRKQPENIFEWEQTVMETVRNH
jgi:hypothetical protein